MKKILLVYNPVSGGANFKKKLDAVVEICRRRKILLSFYRTRLKDSAEEFAEHVKIFGAEGIVSAGGDGTLHRVVNWTKKLRLDLPIGIIASGTSNDFATHLEILSAEKCFDAVAENHVRPADLGLIGDEFFVNVASAGVLTSIAHEVDSRQKNALGKVAYYIRGLGELPNFKAVPLKISADGKNFLIDAFLFLVLNSPAVAGLKKITDAAKIDDGKLDFLALKKCSPTSLLKLTKKILAGQSVENDPNVFYLQAKNFEIDSAAELVGDVDGEVGEKLPIKIETVHHAVKFFA